MIRCLFWELDTYHMLISVVEALKSKKSPINYVPGKNLALGYQNYRWPVRLDGTLSLVRDLMLFWDVFESSCCKWISLFQIIFGRFCGAPFNQTTENPTEVIISLTIIWNFDTVFGLLCLFRKWLVNTVHQVCTIFLRPSNVRWYDIISGIRTEVRF